MQIQGKGSQEFCFGYVMFEVQIQGDCQVDNGMHKSGIQGEVQVGDVKWGDSSIWHVKP